jgi:hypothetical protein
MSWAQPKAVFLNPDHEMGTLLWQMPSHTMFEVTNKGKSPLNILNVDSGCGCANVSWTTEAIAPGASGFVSVTYDAALLGSFHRCIEVFTNEGSGSHLLTISGKVTKTRKHNPGDFPYHVGEYFLHTDNLEFDDVPFGEETMQTLRIYNSSDRPYTPTLMHLPQYLTATYSPQVIHPGEVGKINVWFNAQKARRLGLTQTNIYLSRFPGDKVSKENEIIVSALVLPVVTVPVDGTEKVPQAQVSTTLLDLGSMAGMRSLKGNVKLENKGNAPLVINALQVYNTGMRVKIGSRTIEPGKSKNIQITVMNDEGRPLKGRQSVLLLTNDPVQPKIVIDVLVKK